MHDTDRVIRQPSALQYIDLTPTTAPSWSPSPVARLARGTMLPAVARPIDLDGAATTRFERVELAEPVKKARRASPKGTLAEALTLGVREQAPPRRWGEVRAVGFDGELIGRAAARAAARAARPSAPLRVELALTAAIAIVVALAIGVWARDGAPGVPQPVAAAEAPPVAAPVVTIIPLPPEPAAPAEPAEPAEIEMPAITAPAAPRVARSAAPAPLGMTGGEGTVMIGSKPPCRILVDGRDTGLRTPTRDLRLPAGDHEITLVNDEYGIEDRSTITVAAGAPVRLVRDLTALLPAL